MKVLLVLAILRAMGAQGDRATAERYATEIKAEADRYQIDPLLVVALGAHESRFDARAVGRDGRDVGLFQLRRGSGAGGKHTRVQLQEPSTNIRIAVAHLARLVRVCGDVPKALGAYNVGTCRAKSVSSRRRAIRYARRVEARYREIWREVVPVSVWREPLAVARVE